MPPGGALSPKLCFVYLFALTMSLKEGATMIGKNRSVYFSSPTNAALKRVPPVWEKAQDQLTFSISHLVVKF